MITKEIQLPTIPETNIIIAYHSFGINDNNFYFLSENKKQIIEININNFSNFKKIDIPWRIKPSSSDMYITVNNKDIFIQEYNNGILKININETNDTKKSEIIKDKTIELMNVNENNIISFVSKDLRNEKVDILKIKN